MVNYFHPKHIKQYYINGSFYVPFIGYLLKSRGNLPNGTVNIYGVWNSFISSIFSYFKLIRRRRIIWFFKGLVNWNNWCEFEHYYYMPRFLTQKEIEKIRKQNLEK